MIYKSNARKLMACLLVSCILFPMLGFQACPKGQSGTQKTTYRKIGEASDDIANGVNKTRLALIALEQDGKITRNEANAVRLELFRASDIAEEYTKLIKKHKLFTPDAKKEVEKWAADLASANIRLVSSGSYHVKNADAQRGLSTTIAVISAAIATITVLVSDLKVQS